MLGFLQVYATFYQNYVLYRKMLQLGCSEPWPIAMEILTGQKNMDAGPLLRYFAPIYEWLKEENNRTGEYVGWESE